MERALHGKEDKGDPLSLEEYINLENSAKPKQWKEKPHCPDCLEPVYAWDKRRAITGFYVVRNEVTKPRSKPGFHHYPVDPSDIASPVLTCPSSYRDDPRFDTLNLRMLIDSNRFHYDERLRNEFALNEPKMARSLDILRQYLMKRLTGEDVISQQNKKDMDEARKGLITLAGLAEHPWALPYLEVLTVSARKREFKSRYMSRPGHEKKPRVGEVKYDQKGDQKLPVTFADGEKGFLHLPVDIFPSFVKRHGVLKHMENPQNHEELSIPVTRSFALARVKPVLEQMKTERLREESEKGLSLDFSQTISAQPSVSASAAIASSEVPSAKPAQVAGQAMQWQKDPEPVKHNTGRPSNGTRARRAMELGGVKPLFT